MSHNSPRPSSLRSLSKVVWRNGQPYCERYGDYYFSRHDGRTECRHVFIDGNNLLQRWPEENNFTIGELGFGTGLNFLETWRLWRSARTDQQRLSFISVEGHPMTADIAMKALTDWPDLSPLTDRLLANWQKLGRATVELDAQTELTVIQADALDAIGQFPQMVDAWYLDGFSPSVNPEMWSLPLMRAIAKQSNTGATFASYTAAGWVRRNLSEAGFIVEKQPGFGTKRDMIAGYLSDSGTAT